MNGVAHQLPGEEIMNTVTTKLARLVLEHKMPESHGLSHCKTVLSHMDKAISTSEGPITALLTPEKKLTLRLAALLHEADDHKYFPDNDKFQNARRICSESISDSVSERERIISDVILMISLVSASVNGNSVPEAARDDPTLLWPRWCDRLESIGIIGVVRCYQFTREKGTEPLMLDTSPRPQTEEELWQSVTEDRWARYQSSGGKSASMMDHYYDKLLHIAKLEPEVVQSSYLVQEARRRVAPLVDICIEAGISGQAPVKSLDKLEASLVKE